MNRFFKYTINIICQGIINIDSFIEDLTGDGQLKMLLKEYLSSHAMQSAEESGYGKPFGISDFTLMNELVTAEQWTSFFDAHPDWDDKKRDELVKARKSLSKKIDRIISYSLISLL